MQDEFYEYLKRVKSKEEFIEVFEAVFNARYGQREQALQGEYLQKLDGTKELHQEQTWLVQKGRKGIISDDLLKTQLEGIGKKITLAEMSLNNTYQEKMSVENLLSEAYAFCRTVEIAWYNALPEVKVIYQKLIFPSGITYHFDGWSNQDTGLPFKLINDIGSKDPTDVDSVGIEPTASSM